VTKVGLFRVFSIWTEPLLKCTSIDLFLTTLVAVSYRRQPEWLIHSASQSSREVNVAFLLVRQFVLSAKSVTRTRNKYVRPLFDTRNIAHSLNRPWNLRI